MKRLLEDRRGALYVYAVIIVAVIVGCVVAFVLMAVIGAAQGAFNPTLEANYVVDEDFYTAFGYASSFVTNLWTVIVAFVFFILGYWVYIYSQRRSAGYQ